MKYDIKCSNGHELEVGASELEDILTFNLCPKCEKDIVSVIPEEISMECPLCTYDDRTHWSEVVNWFIRDCPNCGKHGFDSSLHINGSFQFETETYENIVDVVNTNPYKKGSRPDYWEIVTHYCTREEFLSILKHGIIRSSETGYFRKKAVCLTETPIAYASEIREVHGNYGIAFRKKQIVENNGQPVIHLTDDLIKAQKNHSDFSDKIKPFIQLLRIPSTAPRSQKAKKVDFLHEREWRVSSDISFNKIKPIGVVLPSGHAYLKFAGTDWEELIGLAYLYGEIRD